MQRPWGRTTPRVLEEQQGAHGRASECGGEGKGPVQAVQGLMGFKEDCVFDPEGGGSYGGLPAEEGWDLGCWFLMGSSWNVGQGAEEEQERWAWLKGRRRTKLDGGGPSWMEEDRAGARRTELDGGGPSWTGEDRAGLGRVELDRGGPSWTRGRQRTGKESVGSGPVLKVKLTSFAARSAAGVGQGQGCS